MAWFDGKYKRFEGISSSNAFVPAIIQQFGKTKYGKKYGFNWNPRKVPFYSPEKDLAKCIYTVLKENPPSLKSYVYNTTKKQTFGRGIPLYRARFKAKDVGKYGKITDKTYSYNLTGSTKKAKRAAGGKYGKYFAYNFNKWPAASFRDKKGYKVEVGKDIMVGYRNDENYTKKVKNLWQEVYDILDRVK